MIQADQNTKLYQETKKRFEKSLFISTASIQRYMQVSYRDARNVLDKLILDDFASEQIGAFPCIVMTGRYKNLKYKYGRFLQKKDMFVWNFKHLIRHDVPFKLHGIYTAIRYEIKRNKLN